MNGGLKMPNDIANNMADTIHQLEKELKDLREENKVLMQECDRLIKEKGELNELKEKAMSDIYRREARLREAKRLLKAAVEDIRHCMRSYDPCEVCALLEENGECVAADDDDCSEKYKWHYESEALALIGEDGDTNG
jgi:ElaB/YqjD/DUF883 family membrane-anchored ribosome-binding protein